jgi:hypothetical protein
LTGRDANGVTVAWLFCSDDSQRYGLGEQAHFGGSAPHRYRDRPHSRIHDAASGILVISIGTCEAVSAPYIYVTQRGCGGRYLIVSFRSDYFMLGHNDSNVSHELKRRLEYIACLKHALLFHRKMVLADHMVVNSPNFRIAYHNDKVFRDLICEEFVEIFHFDRVKNGPHFTLAELREFHARAQGDGKHLFHRNMPPRFKTEAFDSELEFLQRNVPQTYSADTALRDPWFTDYVDDAMARDFLKAELGRVYPSYELAYQLLKEDVMRSSYPILGIIHFDPDHSYKGTRNIFEYMSEVPRMRNWSTKRLVDRFGSRIARAHRALMVRSEINVIGAHAILPSDLRDYRTLILPSSELKLLDPAQRKEHRIPIELGALDIEALASLTIADIRECRKLGESFLDVMDQLKTQTDLPVSKIEIAPN